MDPVDPDADPEHCEQLSPVPAASLDAELFKNFFTFYDAMSQISRLNWPNSHLRFNLCKSLYNQSLYLGVYQGL